MLKLILFVHLLASIGMGFYLLLPFLVQRLEGRQNAVLGGVAGVLVTANRVGQYLLILQFLTGGYMISKADYSYLWMVLTGIIFLAMAACAGMLGKPLKRFRDAHLEGKSAEGEVGRIRTLGVLIGVSFAVMIFLMKYPELFV
jgi:hypothetical protein